MFVSSVTILASSWDPPDFLELYLHWIDSPLVNSGPLYVSEVFAGTSSSLLRVTQFDPPSIEYSTLKNTDTVAWEPLLSVIVGVCFPVSFEHVPADVETFAHETVNVDSSVQLLPSVDHRYWISVPWGWLSNEYEELAPALIDCPLAPPVVPLAKYANAVSLPVTALTFLFWT